MVLAEVVSNAKDPRGDFLGITHAVQILLDLHIRGCPPTPMQLLVGLLALLQTNAR